MATRLIGVGVGPGSPDLLTIRALRRLREADAIFAPTMAANVQGRAESIVLQADSGLVIRRLVFAIIRDEAARAEAHRAAAQAVHAELALGRSVAFITLGDPNVYSTFHHLVRHVRQLDPEVDVETVPGIMAFQALASEASVLVTDDVETLRIVTGVNGVDDIAVALDDPSATVVVYKGGRHVKAIVDLLQCRDRLAGAVFGELLGLEGSVIAPLTDVSAESVAYLSTIIVPPQRSAP